MRNLLMTALLTGSVVACTGNKDSQPTEIPNPSAADSGSARANSTTNATANPELDVNTSTNTMDAESYQQGKAKKGK